MTAPIIALDSVGRSFDDGRITALRSVTLALARGELLALHGQSGSGKSTLFNLMAGLDLPSAGVVSFAGQPAPSPAAWTRLRAGPIGLVFQDFNLIPTLTAVENIEVAMLAGLRGAARRRRQALALLEELAVAYCAGRLPRQMSGGERRRVAIARALANNPEVLLADEPTSNLDSATGAIVSDLLLDLHRGRGMTQVIITHDPALIARCDRRVRLLDGSVVEDSREPAA